MGAGFLTLVGIVFIGFHTMPFWLAESIGTLLAIASGVYSIRVLVRLVATDRLPNKVRRMLEFFHLVTPDFTNTRADERFHGGPTQ